MIEKSTKQRVMQAFFDEPTREFHLRELSRFLNISLPTTLDATAYLAKKKLIIKEKGKITTNLKANRDATIFLYSKIVANLENLFASGIIDSLIDEYNHPQCIILFGSYARGEDIERSDIDIAIITDKKKAKETTRYQKILKRETNIHLVDLQRISDEFKINLMNGIVLEGSW